MPPPNDAPDGVLSFTSSPHGTIEGIWGPDLAQDLPSHDTRSPVARSQAYLTRWRSLYGLLEGDVTQLKHATTQTWSDLGTTVRFRQSLPDGTPILHHDMRVWIRHDGRITGAWGAVLPPLPVPPAELSAQEAADHIRATGGYSKDSVRVDPDMVVFDPARIGRKDEPPHRAWLVDVHDVRLYMSATTGEELHRVDLVHGGDVMEIYHSPEELNNILVFERDETNGDQHHEPWPSTTLDGLLSLEAVHTLLGNELIDRDGWNNDHDDPLHRSALYVADWLAGGAWWVPNAIAAAFAFGIGNEKFVITASNTTCPDVIAHELIGHGVADAQGIFASDYHEGSALQEGHGDVFGMLVELDMDGTTSWKVGTGGACTWEALPLRDVAHPENPSDCPTCRIGTSNYSNLLRWKVEGDEGPEPSRHNDGGVIRKLGWLLGREPSEGPVSFGGQANITGIGHLEAGALLHDVMTGFATATTDLNQFGVLLRQAAHARYVFGPPFFEVQRAVHAVGLWRPDQALAGANSSSLRPATQSFTVGSEDRIYYFFTELNATGLDHDIKMQHRTCHLNLNTCSFSAPIDLGVDTRDGMGGLGVARTSDQMHVFYGSGPFNPLRQVTIDSNGAVGTEHSYSSTPVYGSPAVVPLVLLGVPVLDVYYRGADASPPDPAPIYNILVSVADPNQYEGPVNTGLTASGSLDTATVDGTTYVVYVDDGKFKAFTPANPSDPVIVPPLQEDVTVVGSASAANTWVHDRLHVAAQTPEGRVAYKSFCPPGATCTYRPDDWTNTVELPELVGSPSWFVLHGGPLLGSTLSRFTALLHGSESSTVRQRMKGGE
jgi:hypothetical protein